MANRRAPSRAVSSRLSQPLMPRWLCIRWLVDRWEQFFLFFFLWGSISPLNLVKPGRDKQALPSPAKEEDGIVSFSAMAPEVLDFHYLHKGVVDVVRGHFYPTPQDLTVLFPWKTRRRQKARGGTVIPPAPMVYCFPGVGHKDSARGIHKGLPVFFGGLQLTPVTC